MSVLYRFVVLVFVTSCFILKSVFLSGFPPVWLGYYPYVFQPCLIIFLLLLSPCAKSSCCIVMSDEDAVCFVCSSQLFGTLFCCLIIWPLGSSTLWLFDCVAFEFLTGHTCWCCFTSPIKVSVEERVFLWVSAQPCSSLMCILYLCIFLNHWFLVL